MSSQERDTSRYRFLFRHLRFHWNTVNVSMSHDNVCSLLRSIAWEYSPRYRYIPHGYLLTFPRSHFRTVSNDPDIAIRIDKANRRFVVSAMPLGLIATVQMYGILVPRGEEDTMMAYAIKYPLPEIALALAMVVFTLCFGASMAVVALVAFKSVNIGLLVGDIGLSAFLLLGQYVLLWRAPADSGRRDEQIFVQKIVEPLKSYTS